MNYKTTSKGTELPLLNLKGKDYLQVAHRLVWFREDHPSGKILTSVLQLSDKSAIFKAEIFVLGIRERNGQPEFFESLLATAHKKETEENFGDFIEKAETGAIGRALAMAGYGTQFDPELDEGVRLADAPTSVAARGTGAKPVGKSPQAGEKPPVAPISGSSQGTSRKLIDDKIRLTSKVIVDSKRASLDQVLAKLADFGVKGKDELNDEQAKAFLTVLEGMLK